MTFLRESLSFDDLLRVSEPKRLVRSMTVRIPPLQVDAYKNSMYYGFSAKSYPSTTGLRHKGYILFKKPTKPTPMGKVECEVGCSCEDFRYRWAWADKQHGSAKVGPNSISQTIDRAPRITNPQGRPGLCKHILALRDFIKGQMSDKEFIGSGRDTGTLLNKLVAQSKGQWIDREGAKAKGRERERRYAAHRQQQNRRGPEPEPEPEPESEPEPEPERSEVPQSPAAAPVSAPISGVPRAPVSLPSEMTEPPEGEPSEEEREMPPTGRVESVDKPKRSFMKILEELDSFESGMATVETPPDAEALEILREIRDLLKELAGEDEGEDEGEGKEEDGLDDDSGEDIEADDAHVEDDLKLKED